MVVEPDATRADLTEAVLAECRFAVAPVVSVEAALTVSRTLLPAVIVCALNAADRLREASTVPVVPNDPSLPGALIERIREAIHDIPRTL